MIGNLRVVPDDIYHHGGVTLRAALQRILHPYDLVPVIRHEVLLITTRADAESWRDQSGVQELLKSTLQKLVEELQKPTTAEFDDQPLGEVCQFFSNIHGITLLVDSAAEDDDADLPITANLSGVSLAAALEFICDQYGLTCIERGDEVLVRRAGNNAE